jgi:hypothetical protein
MSQLKAISFKQMTLAALTPLPPTSPQKALLN